MKNFVKILLLSILIAGTQSCKEEPEPPEFNITASATHILAGQTITFSQNAVDGTESVWTLEGSTTPTATGSTVTATFNTPGVFTISVTVKNKGGNTTKTISVIVETGTWTFQFPGGENNNNATIGDFCCTGQTITVRNDAGNPLGYAYFYGWQGQAFTLPDNTSIAPNFEILISGTTDLNGVPTRVTSSVFFPTNDNVVGRVKTVQVGKLEYTMRILAISYPIGTPYVDTHFIMGSLIVEVKVRWVP